MWNGGELPVLPVIPLIRDGGRLMDVSSMSGHLNSKYPDAIRNAFASSKIFDQIAKLMETCTAAVKEGKEKEKGWPSAAYAVSKSGITVMARAIAHQNKAEGGKVLVNSCCPGFVVTDLTKGRGAKTADEGARTPALLALGKIHGKYGEFWQHQKVIER